MYRRLLMARQAEEDRGSVLSVRRHFCGETEICPSHRFCGAVVRGDGGMVFVVGEPRRLRLGRKDRVYCLDLALGGLPLSSHRTVFRVPWAADGTRQISAAVRYRVELQAYRSFFLSHYRLVTESAPLMATARFSPFCGAPLPCLLSEIGESVARLCERAAAQAIALDREGSVDTVSLRRAIGEAVFDLDEYGISVLVDAPSLTLLRPPSATLARE